MAGDASDDDHGGGVAPGESRAGAEPGPAASGRAPTTRRERPEPGTRSTAPASAQRTLTEGPSIDPVAADAAAASAGGDLAYGETLAPGAERPGNWLAGGSARAPASRGSGELPMRSTDRYELLGEHAAGGLGRILDARDREIGRTIAVKQPLVDSPEVRERFAREALITARLAHPSIVPVYELGRWPSGRPFYAMKKIEGRPLGELIGAAAALEARLALLPNALAVADAVAYAHSQGIVHRDLKPSNVLVGDYGETVVIDWGIAKDLGAGDDDELPPLVATDAPSLTVAGAVLGTPSYMAPEQARGGAIDERTDVYALGAIVYAIVGGQAPYRSTKDASALAQVLEGPPPPVTGLAPGAPAELVSVVDKAMAREPGARYSSAAELAAELRRYLAGRRLAAHAYSPLGVIAHWIRHHKLTAAVAATALALLAIIGGVAIANVIAARDQARAQEAEAKLQRAAADAQKRQAEAARDDLVLAQARGALDRDPTEALAWLKHYPEQGAKLDEAQAIATDAISRGVARHVVRAQATPLVFEALSETRLVTGDDDGSARIRELATGEIIELPGHETPVNWLNVSPDGKWIVSTVYGPGRVRQWDAETGELIRVLGELDSSGQRPHFTADGRLVVVAGLDGEIRLWNLATGELAFESRVDLGAEWALVTPDAAGIVVATSSPDLIVIDTRSGGLRRLQGHTGRLTAADLTVDGTRAVTSATDGDIRLWDLTLATSTVLTRHDGEASFVELAPDDCCVVSVGSDRVVRAGDLAGTAVRSHRLHETAPMVARFSADGRLIASAGDGEDVVLWSWRDQQPGMLRGHGGGIPWLSFAPGSPWLFSVSRSDGQLRSWELHRWPTTRWLGHRAPIRALARLDRGRTLLTASADRTVIVWDVETATARSRLTGHGGPVLAITVGGTEDWFATGDTEGSVRLWRVGEQTSRALPGAGTAVLRLGRSVDDRFLVAAREGGEIAAWRLDQLDAEPRTVDSAEPSVAIIRLSDVEPLVAYSSGSKLMTWDLASDQSRTLTVHDGPLVEIRWRPGGTDLVTASNDGTIRVTSASTGRQRIIHTAEGPLQELVMSPTGAMAAVNHTGRVLWWPPELDEHRTLGRLAEPRPTLEFNQDGTRLIGISRRAGQLTLWDLEQDARWRIHHGAVAHTAEFLDANAIALATADGSVVLVDDLPRASPPRRGSLAGWLSEATSARVSVERAVANGGPGTSTGDAPE